MPEARRGSKRVFMTRSNSEESMIGSNGGFRSKVSTSAKFYLGKEKRVLGRSTLKFMRCNEMWKFSARERPDRRSTMLMADL